MALMAALSEFIKTARALSMTLALIAIMTWCVRISLSARISISGMLIRPIQIRALYMLMISG